MGGVAVGVHGIPRPTHDLDFTISVDRGRLSELYEAAEHLGYSVADAHFTGWGDLVAGMPLVRVWQGVEGKAVDIDIFLAESPFQSSIVDRRLQMEVDGVAAWVVTPEDLILLKLIADRPRDIGGIWDILLAQGQLDMEYIRHWADRLGVSEKWDDVLAEIDLGNGN